MTVPPPVLRGVEEALELLFGRAVSILSSSHVGGGCINPSAKLEVEGGDHFFLKWNPAADAEMFDAEADGLQALARPGSLRVPEVLGKGGTGTSHDPGWLLLEFIPQGRPGPDYGKRLGAGLAALHSAGSSQFGWSRDNFIGSLPQENDLAPDWTTFWRDRRLLPQLTMARRAGHFSGGRGRILDQLLDDLDRVMVDSAPHGPGLLHGDLWSGNFYPDSMGEPVLIDPAVYRGVGEVDLAMMELFGSFPRGFEEEYGAARELAPEYGAFRRDLYQLYYLLVHVNLFGGSYVSGSTAAARRALEGA